MKDLPLRRGQLVTTFGPGSLVISPEGESAMVGSLDKWYFDRNENRAETIDEYDISEPRLKSVLKVEKLMMPPDFRPSFKYKKSGSAFAQTNTDLYIPLLRFPTWHYCPVCKTLHQSTMSNRTSWMDCKECKGNRKMLQVPFVMVCKKGHIADFPWREWVHSDENTRCEGRMKLSSSGGATLDSLKVKCSCTKERSLRGIMSRKSTEINENEVSMLSQMLNDENDKMYYCPGHKPWYGSENDKETCSEAPLAVLKNSINVYYPKTISAIHLPGDNLNVEKLIAMFDKYNVTASWLKLNDTFEGKRQVLKQLCPPEIDNYDWADIELAILYIEGGSKIEDETQQTSIKNVELQLRVKEFETLVKEGDSENLKIRKEWTSTEVVEDDLKTYFSLINRVTKLKETIALTGFNRLTMDDDEKGKNQLSKGKKLLFKDPELPENNWLPAYKVFGEGIFFTLNMEELIEWEQKPIVKNYFRKIVSRIEKGEANVQEHIKTPRNVLLHTLSHIIIDELALTCGYNAASLRERLYLGEEQGGILIYTSSGDIEGTFGGLVRMGKIENFFPVVNKAIDKARWCSSDPVCSEIGKSSGQGFNNLNGAACHSCSYLPETSCELVNLFLDRTLVIDPKVGFFNRI